MSRKNWCKHYNGAVNKSCKAGVFYATVELGHGTPLRSLPCFKDDNQLSATCEKCEFRTPEEVAVEEAELKKRFEDMTKARTAIVEALGGPWKKGMPGHRGRIACPVCGKADSLAFSRSGYNGHIHAHCSTADCVAWME